jgi:hypothetical protein
MSVEEYSPADTAWSMVLAAIEAAIDVDDLPPDDGAVFAHLHDFASRQSGSDPIAIPADLALSVEQTAASRDGARERRRRWEAATVEGGIFSLDLPTAAAYALMRAGYVTVDALPDDVDPLRALRGVGPKSMHVIRAAVEKRAANAEAG